MNFFKKFLILYYTVSHSVSPYHVWALLVNVAAADCAECAAVVYHAALANRIFLVAGHGHTIVLYTWARFNNNSHHFGANYITFKIKGQDSTIANRLFSSSLYYT